MKSLVTWKTISYSIYQTLITLTKSDSNFINQIDYFHAFAIYVLPVLVFILRDPFRNNLISFCIKTNDLVSNWRRPAYKFFMLEVHYHISC